MVLQPIIQPSSCSAIPVVLGRRYFGLLALLLFLLMLLSTIVAEEQGDTTTTNEQEDRYYIPPENDGIRPDIPEVLDSDTISYLFEERRIDDLYWTLIKIFTRSVRNIMVEQIAHPHLPEKIVSRGGGSTYTTAYKLKHDIEQARYLVDNVLIEDDPRLEYYRGEIIPVLEHILERIPPLEKLEKTFGLYPFREYEYRLNIQDYYNKGLYLSNGERLIDEETGRQLPHINPELNVERIERQWLGKDKKGGVYNQHPGIVVVDDLLTPAALKEIQRIMWESTVWYQTKLPLKFGGYVGAYIDDGLYDRILLQVSLDLYDKFPAIFEGHPLKYMWAYKYDSEYTGINLHADQAAVNVNVWLTPDEANFDPKSGGLVVFTAKPPADWDFAQYNTDTEFVRDKLLKPTNFANVTIPYKTNRAVIFDSALFHQTDHFSFKNGYKNRRINLTLLYGDMQMARQQQQQSSQQEL